MLITISLFLAVVLLLIVGYIGELITSAGTSIVEEQDEKAMEQDYVLSPTA